MPHIHHSDAKKSMGDKLQALTGKRGEYPPDRAARICGTPITNASAQGDAARAPQENFVAAPARQVGDQGSVKGD
jgi:hypothetical protein